ncbi:hypothetical protein MP228_012820 [Amoeboaphelidium protococcarum]|nr:hypothetical protein MP228_012820 [Amoeboaphelidium protococcarum]
MSDRGDYQKANNAADTLQNAMPDNLIDSASVSSGGKSEGDVVATEEMESIVEILAHKLEDHQLASQKRSQLNIEDVCKSIRDGKIQNIIVMSGAGISTSCGIPDFRSPSTGLYSNLEKFNLPYPEAIFDMEFFLEEPEPFYALAKELYPGNFTPSLAHHFIKLLATKKLLLRNYTQNIDTLERVAGIDEELLIEAHGSFHAAHCVNQKCRRKYKHEAIKAQVFNDEIPRCDKCKSLVKPDIIFFGEGLPQRFFKSIPGDFAKCDLLIVMGTSLTVHPFASLITQVMSTVPRILINMERVGTQMLNGFDFDNQHGHGRDIMLQGRCDDEVSKLANLLGWSGDLQQLQGCHSSQSQSK